MTAVAEHRAYAPLHLGFAVLTVSDSRRAATDGSGELLRRMATEAGHGVLGSELVPDEAEAIQEAACRLLAVPGVDVLVVTGGTGFSPRDRTVPALTPLFEVEIPGFGELFRMLSYREIGAAAMLSRATAGVVGGKLVFLLPGSPKAVELAARELVLPEAGHLLGQLRRPS
jgi:molybdopterin adenylyltransferase